MRWTADPPKAFPTLSSSDLFCPSVSGHGSSSRFYLSTLSRLSQGTAYSYLVTLMVRPLLVAEPGPGDASCTTWTLAVFIHHLRFLAGRPSSKFTVCRSSALQPPPSVSNQPAFFVRFQSYDLLLSFPATGLVRSVPVLQPSLRASDLFIFFVRFRSCDLPFTLPICRSFPSVSGLSTFSVLPATPTFRLVGFCLRGIQGTLLSINCQSPKWVT